MRHEALGRAIARVLALTVTAAVPVAGLAQEQAGGIEEIVVTARKRTESLQDVPVAVSAFSNRQIEVQQIETLYDMTARVPNMLVPVNSVAASAPQVWMRGVGRNDANWNVENAVALFFDDVYYQSTFGAMIDVIEMERIEVLRGPQGTLYGRNATTGAVKFIPKRPDLDHSTWRLEATYGEYDRIDVIGGFGTPLIEDRLGIKVDLFRRSHDGWVQEVREDASGNPIGPGADDVYEQESYGGRVALLYEPRDDLELEFNLDYRAQRDGVNVPTAMTVDAAGRYVPLYGVNRGALNASISDPEAEFDGYGGVFKLRWELGPGTLSAITGYRTYDNEWQGQLGARSQPISIPVPFGTISLGTFIDSVDDFEQFTQELQYVGHAGERFTYVLGAYYFDNDWEQTQEVGLLIPVEFNPPRGGAINDIAQNSKSYALFADATYAFTDRLSVTAGARWTRDEKTVDYTTLLQNGFTLFELTGIEESWDEVTPRASIDFRVTPESLVYLSYSEGYKAGQLAGSRTTDPVSAQLWQDPETVKTAELGLKADWFAGVLRTNVALFTSKYENKADAFIPSDGTSTQIATADVNIDGAELELTWSPTNNASLFATVGYLDAEYDGELPADHPALTTGTAGRVVYTPELTYTIGGLYEWELGDGSNVTLAGTFRHVDEYASEVSDVRPFEQTEAYDLLDANLAWVSPAGRWTVRLAGENLTDEDYWTTGLPALFTSRYYGPGRTWSINVRYSVE